MFALKVENLHKSFLSRFTNKQGKEEQETAELLRGVDFELTEGTITAVLGSNGSKYDVQYYKWVDESQQGCHSISIPRYGI